MMAKFRTGRDLDREDDDALDSMSRWNRGEIIGIHDELQRQVDEVTAREPAGPEAPISDAMPTPEQAGGFDPGKLMREGALDDAIGNYRAPSTVAGEGAERERPGGAGPILPPPLPEEEEAAEPPPLPVEEVAGAAGGLGGWAKGLGVAGAAAGATFAAAKIWSQEAAAVGMPGGGMAGPSGSDDMRALLEVQKQVAKIGLPVKGLKSTGAGNKL